MPRNSLVNGKLAPDSFGVQLDEVAYPILMARTVGLTDNAFYLAHIKRAADFVVAHGPAFGNERWEEQSGLLAVHDRGRDRRAGRGRRDRRPERRRRRGHGSTAATADQYQRMHQGLDRDHDRTAQQPSRTSSGCPRPATRTRRSATTSATAARTPTSAP